VLLALMAGSSLHSSNASPMTIADDRIRDLDVSPVLGRGYSIATNSFQSTCLTVEKTSEPSYNYEYYYTDFTEDTDTESQMTGKVAGSFGYWGIKAEMAASSTSNSKSKTKKHFITATMRIERYYSSLLEDKSHLSDDAKTLLEREDYIGFFKACGPNYVRGIRRAQEVSAIFSFESVDSSSAKEFAASLKVSGYGQKVEGSMNRSSKSQSIKNTLTIKINGWGLGLNKSGSDTLVATSLEEFNGVMKFAFDSMTKSESDSGQTGMVYGMEVVPWTDNTSFQVACRLQESILALPMPRNLIKNQTSPGKCPRGLEADDTNKCCDGSVLEELETTKSVTDAATGITVDVKKTRCEPMRILPPTVLKNNLANNGEFIAMLDSVTRYKMNSLFTLEKCVAGIRAFPKRYDDFLLKTKDTVKYDATLDTEFSVGELKMALDPLEDFSLVTMVAHELDEFVAMFYDPCIAAINGMNIGVSQDTDPKYFMAESWYNHPECSYVSCLADNMAWDRKNGGCTPGITAQTKAVTYSENDVHCAKKLDIDGETEICKHSPNTAVFNECSKDQDDNHVASSYIVDHFCMPQLKADGGKASSTKAVEIKKMSTTCDAAVNKKNNNPAPTAPVVP